LGFAERREQHDARALPLVRSAFEAHGFHLYPFGGELSPELQEMLRRLQNGTSRMLRYRPDMVAVHPAKGSLLLEVKSEGTGSPNFAVEFDAWDAARLWNQNARRVLYLFVDLLCQDVLARWPEDLRPRRVFVPRREDLARIRAVCPGVSTRCYPAVRGSGTAFFLVAKSELKLLGAALGGWRR
jgi:hypothetical protein